MNKSLRTRITMLIATAIMAGSMLFLASCSDTAKPTATTKGSVTASSDASQATGEGTEASGSGAETEATLPKMEILPSAAPKDFMIGKNKVNATEFDFYFYMITQQYSMYVQYGMITADENGKIDLDSPADFAGQPDMTVGEYIAFETKNNLQSTYILEAGAKKDKISLSEKNQSAIDNFYAKIEEDAKKYNVTSDEFLKYIYGETASAKTLTPAIERYFLANMDYLEHLQSTYTFSEKELNDFYEANKETSGFTGEELPTVRHILFEADKEASEEAHKKAETLANDLVKKVKSEEDMIALGEAALADQTAREAAEYTVEKGQMVAPFEEWAYDTKRKEGDTEVVKTDYGYHVMFFVGKEVDWLASATKGLTDERIKALINENKILPAFAMTVEGKEVETTLPAVTTSSEAAETSAEDTAPETSSKETTAEETTKETTKK